MIILDFPPFLNAQEKSLTTILKINNLPRPGDTLIKQQVDYIDPGISGTNIIWDFRSVNPVNDHYYLHYLTGSSDPLLINGIEHGTVYSYLISGDSLIHTGYENSTTIMKYDPPEIRLKFPLRYGDIICGDFSGRGEYCHMTALNVSGITTVSADATGTLYTPLGLTFKNVLRVKSLREYFQTGIDSVTMKMESYSWYVSGNRYPVFETIKTATKKTGRREMEHKVASFFYPPADQAHLLDDTTNWVKQDFIDEVKDIDQLFSNCQLKPNPVTSKLIIEYELTQDATISFRIIDGNGMVRCIIPDVGKNSGKYSDTIEMDKLPPGIYIINVFVNEMLKSIKVVKI